MSGSLFGPPRQRSPLGDVCRWKVRQYTGSSQRTTLPSLSSHSEWTGGAVPCAPRWHSDGQMLDSVLEEPDLLALRDTMTTEKGEVNTGHWHFISLLSQTLGFVLKIQNGNPEAYWVWFSLPRVRWMFLSKFHTVSLKVQVSIIWVELEYFWLRLWIPFWKEWKMLGNWNSEMFPVLYWRQEVFQNLESLILP